MVERGNSSRVTSPMTLTLTAGRFSDISKVPTEKWQTRQVQLKKKVEGRSLTREEDRVWKKNREKKMWTDKCDKAELGERIEVELSFRDISSHMVLLVVKQTMKKKSAETDLVT